MSASKPTCFVIMPFSKTERHPAKYWTTYFREYLKPLIEDIADVEVRRSQALRGNIVAEIIKDLCLSEVVVADLTDYNPNVFWELGVRQSFKHGTITIAERGTRLPFDLGAKGTLFYSPKDLPRNAYFRRRLKEAIQDSLTHPDRPDSLVLETLSGRGTLFEIVHKEESIRRLDGLLAELTRNDEVRKEIIETAKTNLEKKVDAKFVGKYVTARYRLESTELLITHRYVVEPEDIYVWAEKYHGRLHAENEELNQWGGGGDAVSEWLVEPEYSEKWALNCQEFRRKVESASETLKKRL